MNLTYEQVKQVSQDPTLTPSQKMHEIFKNSKTTPLRYFIENSGLFNRPIEPSIRVDEADRPVGHSGCAPFLCTGLYWASSSANQKS